MDGCCRRASGRIPSWNSKRKRGPLLEARASGGDNKLVGRFSQPLPLSGRLKAQTEVARKGQEITRLERELEARRLVASVRRAFYRVLAAQRGVEVATTSRDIARELRTRADDRVESGAAPQTERIRAGIELARAELALERATSELVQAKQALAALLGDVDLRVERYDGTLREVFPVLSRSRIETEVVRSFPAILLAERRIDAARADYRLADVEWIPDPAVSLGAGRTRQAGDNEAILEWGISIPLPLFNRNQGRIAETRALIGKEVKFYQAVLNETLLRLRQALVRYDQQRSQVQRYKDSIIPQAERALTLIQDGYRQGKFTQIDVLDAQRTVAEARSTYLGLLEELIRTSVEIEELGGKDLSEFSER